MNNCSRRQYLTRVIAVFVFILFYEMILNGRLLMPLYNQTPLLWRPVEDMQTLLPLSIITYLGLACAISSLYSRFVIFTKPMSDGTMINESHTPRTQSLFFGICIGLLLGLPHTLAYVTLPISGLLASAWLITGLMEGILIGLILYYIKSQKEII